jgi:hypothetical protein
VQITTANDRIEHRIQETTPLLCRQRCEDAPVRVYDPAMDDTPCKPVRDEIKWAPSFLLLAAVIVVFLCIVIYQVAFIGGTRVSNELVAPSADADAEIRELRVHLDEGRRFQDTLINVVIASVAAGFTVLVLVNIGVVVVAQRSQEREEKYLRTIFQAEARGLDAEVARGARDELRAEVGRVEARLNETSQSVLRQIVGLQGNVGTLLRSTISHYESDKDRRRADLRLQAELDEVRGRFASAASNWASWISDVAESGDIWSISSTLEKLQTDLTEIEAGPLTYETYLADNIADYIDSALTEAENHGKVDPESAIVTNIRALLAAILEKQAAERSRTPFYVAAPPPSPPPPSPPSTSPISSTRTRGAAAPRPSRRPQPPEPESSDS